MEKKVGEIVAFVLNFLLPDLGFYFSGFVHHRKWLQGAGIGFIAVFIILLPLSVVAVVPYPLINYHFDLSDILFYLVVAFVFGCLGAGVEHEIREDGT